MFEEPINRLNLAKILAIDVVNKLSNRVNVSVSVFGGTRILLAPSTLDRVSIISKIESITIGMSPGGSNLSRILESNFNTLYVFTDGGDTTAQGVSARNSKAPLFFLIGSKS